jgi:hypothetical protein
MNVMADHKTIGYHCLEFVGEASAKLHRNAWKYKTVVAWQDRLQNKKKQE